MSFLFCVFMWCGVRVSCAVVGVDIQLRGQPNCYFLSSTLFESGCLCYSLLSTLTSRSMSLWRFSCVFLWSFHRVVGLTNTKKVCQPFHVFWDSNSDPRAWQTLSPMKHFLSPGISISISIILRDMESVYCVDFQLNAFIFTIMSQCLWIWKDQVTVTFVLLWPLIWKTVSSFIWVINL